MAKHRNQPKKLLYKEFVKPNMLRGKLLKMQQKQNTFLRKKNSSEAKELADWILTELKRLDARRSWKH